MATEPLGQPPAPEAAPSPPDQTEAWRRRALEAEAQAKALSGELADARAELDRLRTDPAVGAGTDGDADSEGMAAIFDDAEPVHSAPTLAADGSDPGVLPMALGSLAAVALVIAALSWLNLGILAPFTLIMLAAAVGFGYFAYRTRVVNISVEISRGIVYIEEGDTSHRFDLRSTSTTVQERRDPGDPGWEVRLQRKYGDPFTVDASMVDPHEFSEQLKQWRPED